MRFEPIKEKLDTSRLCLQSLNGTYCQVRTLADSSEGSGDSANIAAMLILGVLVSVNHHQ
jgi:hypothetical protein